MPATDSTRRSLLVGAAASAALFPFRNAIAQTEAAGGDWLAMVKSHHALIAKSFDDLLAGPTKAGLKKLAYQLTAHSVAEENVLYPALALGGMASDADKLYLDQAHAKVGNAEIDMDAMHGADKSALVEKIRTLQAAVLKHAKEDEEGNLFPKLQQKLDAKQNATLTAEYKQQYASVKPA
jgi:hemerythrin superfamily protein